MKLLIQLSDEHLSAIKEELRVNCAMYSRFFKENSTPATEAEGYALRILKARRMLDLSMAKDEACWDFKGEAE